MGHASLTFVLVPMLLTTQILQLFKVSPFAKTGDVEDFRYTSNEK